MDFHVSLAGHRDIVAQIYQQMRAAIQDGRLPSGQALPPTRELAESLQVSRNSVLSAYDRLSAEGFLVSRVGAGSFVASDAPIGSDTRGRLTKSSLRPKPFWQSFPETEYLDRAPTTFDFRTGIPDSSLFPYPAWRRLMTQELRTGNRRAGKYGDPAGHQSLRAAISSYAAVSRGVQTSPETITVTSGAQQALDLICRVFIERGDCVAVEDPGYPLARLLFESHGARVVPTAVDSEGLIVEALPRDARIVFLTPSHQYPMGMTMSIARRRELLAWADERNAIVVEDDYDCEYRYSERPVEALQSLDRSGRVLYVGSFSKTMIPSIRTGYIVAPLALCRAIQSAKFVSDWHSPIANQVALAKFIDTGLLAAHVRRMREEYRERRKSILLVLRRDFSEWLTPVPSSAGLHLAALSKHLNSIADFKIVQKRALTNDVGISCLSDYYFDQSGRSGLLFGFSTIKTSLLGEGLRRLHQCFKDL